MEVIDTSNFIGDVPIQNIFLFIFIAIFSILIGNIAKILKKNSKPASYRILSKIAMYSIYFFGFYFAFKYVLIFNIPSFLAALGILGITFLLTMLPLLQNIFAGLVVSFERPFKENDVIEVDGNICIVRDIMLRKTILRSLDGKIIIVSNIKFATGEIINYSKGEFIRVELTVHVKNDGNHEKAIGIIDKILHEH